MSIVISNGYKKFINIYMYWCFLHVLKKKPGVHIGIYMDIKIVVVYEEKYCMMGRNQIGFFLFFLFCWLNNEIILNVTKWKIREEAIIGIGWDQLKGSFTCKYFSPETIHTWRIYYVFSYEFNSLFIILY